MPIEAVVREAGDIGKPVVESHPESASAKVFKEIAGGVREALGLAV